MHLSNEYSGPENLHNPVAPRTDFQGFCVMQALTARLIRPLLVLLSLALAGKVGAVGALVSLDVLELAADIPNCVEFLASAAAMCGASCFACHTVSFLLVVLFAVGCSLSDESNYN